MTKVLCGLLDCLVYWHGMANEWVAAGERAWRSAEPHWGCWQISERRLGLLPPDMSGLRAIELGCATGYVSAWLVRRGASSRRASRVPDGRLVG